MWKGNKAGYGLYDQETTLTPANVNTSQFGLLGRFKTDGLLLAQPLYISNVDMGQAGTHNIIIIATEHCSVYAFDADNPGAGSLWERHYLDPANGITPQPDTFGGRSTFDGEVGITGTPAVDPSTGTLYFVTMYLHNGVSEQWLRSIDIHTGKDVGPGGVQVKASVQGDGKASVGGQIAFDPSIENQRSGLVVANGSVFVAWGSFSDKGVYHGWLMAFDPSTLALQAVFNPTPQAQADDPVNGPADHGGGGGFWSGGASPAIDGDGNIYLNTADGSFNANDSGDNYGDTTLKLKLNGNSFQIVDWFTPSDQECLDFLDLDLGSTGVALLPSDVGNGHLAVTGSKEGRLYLLDTTQLGHFDASGDEVPQQFMVGEHVCQKGTGLLAPEGPDWNRLYGTVAYWNGYIYAQASNIALKQYQFQNGTLNTTPIAQTPSASGWRGGGSVVSSNGTQNGILWTYEKNAQDKAILHAYSATSVSHELWNSNMNPTDLLGQGIGFSVPVIADGHVIATSDTRVTVYGLKK
jgi:hypothetical protein